MIYIARPEEPAYLFYAFGLLLIIVAIYVPSSGDLLYPSIAGWTIVIAYLLIGIFHQRMLAGSRAGPQLPRHLVLPGRHEYPVHDRREHAGVLAAPRFPAAATDRRAAQQRRRRCASRPTSCC